MSIRKMKLHQPHKGEKCYAVEERHFTPGECFEIQIFSLGYNWQESEVSETPSIATYQEKKVVYIVRMSKPQCACSQFYVKRRRGRACIYEKPACCSRVQLRKANFTYVKTTKRMHIK